MGTTLAQRSFAAGELDPAFHARADIDAYRQGLRTCRNCIVQRAGGVTNRPGTKFINEVKTSADATFLVEVVFTSASYVLEAGNGYFRFYKNGVRVGPGAPAAWSAVTNYVQGDLVSFSGVNYYAIQANLNQQPDINADDWYPMPAGIYEIPMPYATNRHLLRAVTEGTMTTLTHQTYQPRELRWGGTDTSWTLVPITTEPSIAAPGGVGGSGTAGGLTFKFVITSRKAETYEESLASAVATVANVNAPTQAAPISVTWTDVGATVAEYDVFSDNGTGNGVYGYIGTSSASPFKWDGTALPDYTRRPPIARSLFASVNNYPHASCYYQQRRVFTNTHAAVATVWASRTGFHSNFSIRSPLHDDDAVTFTPAGRNIGGIQHLVPLKRLLVLADGGEIVVYGDQEGVLTPTGMHPEQEGFAGAAHVVPVVIGNTVIYVQYLSRVVRDLRFDHRTAGFRSADLTVMSAHLFRNTILRIDHAETPHSVVWCVRDDGVLLGLTYLPEYEVYGWHRHDTGASGIFEDVVVVPEGTEHAVYVLVKRTINGSTKRYIERFASRLVTTFNTQAYFVDCGITYNGAAATLITGLSHLEGQSVKALADGIVRGPFTVSGGAITLPVAASVVHVGLGITAELETLDLDVATADELRDARKKVQALSVYLRESSRGFQIGPNADALITDTAAPWDAAGVFTGLIESIPKGTFTTEGRMLIRHTDPTPLTVLGVLPHVELGG